MLCVMKNTDRPLTVAQLRKRLNLTKQQLADKLGVCQRTIHRWERGDFHPHAAYVARMSAMYSVQIADELHAYAEEQKKKLGITRNAG